MNSSKVHLDNDHNIDYLNSSRENQDGNSIERENGIIYNDYHQFDVENEPQEGRSSGKKRRQYDPDDYKDG